MSVQKQAARILYVNPISKVGGAEFSLLALMDNLDRSAYEPILLCPTTDGLLPRLCQERNIRTVFLPTIPLPGGRAIDTYRTLPHNVQAIKSIIKELGIDLVHSNTPRVAYHSGLAARWTGIPNVTHVRDMSNTPFASSLKASFLSAISDQIVAVSQATKNVIVEYFPCIEHKIQVVYNGVEPMPKFDSLEIDALRAEFSATDRVVLLATIGPLVPLKGHDVVLRALPSIREKFPNTRLLIVGEGLRSGEDYRSYLIDLASQLQVSQQVVFAGFRRDVPLILSAIDLLIHYPVEFDALPRILLEASAQGTLIVASDIGGIGEVVLDDVTGRLVPPGHPAVLAEAILSLLDSPDLAAQMRTAARKRVYQVFSIEQHVASIEAIYRSLLGQT